MDGTNILAGAEPFFFEGSAVGILLSHGYTGTPQSMRYLGEQLNKLGGFTVLAPRLSGHGVSPDAMSRSKAQDWINDIDKGLSFLRARCDRVFMAGLSMGGCLALFSAARHADLRGIVPINACVHLDLPDFAALAYASDAPKYLKGIGSDIKMPGIAELAYEELPVSTVRELYGLMAVTGELLPRIQCPTLVLQSVVDHVVPSSNGEFIFSKLKTATRQLRFLHHSYHVATLDYDKDLIVSSIIEFLNSHK